MRPEINLRPDIEKLEPKIIIFVKDAVGDVGQPEAFRTNETYRQAAAWLGFSSHDIDTYNAHGEIEADNIVLIMTKTGEFTAQEIRDNLTQPNDQESRYSWESQLPPLEVGRIHEVDDFDHTYPSASD